MRRRLFTLATALSLMMCAAMIALCLRDRRDHHCVGYSHGFTRFTLHSENKHIVLTRTPDTLPADPATVKLVDRLSNNDVSFKPGDPEDTGQGKAVWYHFREHTASRVLVGSWLASGGKSPIAVRELLHALDRPDQYVAAHSLLYFTNVNYSRDLPRSPGNNALIVDGLLAAIPQTEITVPSDPAVRRLLRDRWHYRLDVQAFAIHDGWIVLACAILPVLWLCKRLKSRRNGTGGRCRSCGYNLTGNTSGVCPECGLPIAQFAKATEPQSTRHA